MPHKAFHCGLRWFRRDLRADDNAALFHALKACTEVHCVFVFDKDILDTLPRQDRRVEFIRESLVGLDEELRQLSGKAGAGLIVRHAHAVQGIVQLAKSLGVQAVFANHDYEPAAVARDATVRGALADAGITLHTYKDQVIFERQEVLTQAGKPYGVFTPYKNAWLRQLDDFQLKPYAVGRHAGSLAVCPSALQAGVPGLESLGFERTNLQALHVACGSAGGRALFEDFFHRMDRYDVARDFPAVKGPSYLGVHLRFGTVSVRKLAATAHQMTLQGSRGATTWLGELVWRDFYFQILANFPHVAQRSFKPEYDAIRWEHFLLPGARGARATRWSTQPWHRSIRPATCTTACAWSSQAFCARIWAWTGAGASVTLRSTSLTLTCLPTTADGNGPAQAVATRNPISVSSTRSAKVKSLTPRASSFAVTCHSWLRCPVKPCMRRGRQGLSTCWPPA